MSICYGWILTVWWKLYVIIDEFMQYSWLIFLFWYLMFFRHCCNVEGFANQWFSWKSWSLCVKLSFNHEIVMVCLILSVWLFTKSKIGVSEVFQWWKSHSGFYRSVPCLLAREASLSEWFLRRGGPCNETLQRQNSFVYVFIIS